MGVKTNRTCCVVLLCFVFVLYLVCPMLPVYLDCPFLIIPSVFSNIYFTSQHRNKNVQVPGKGNIKRLGYCPS